MNEKLKAFKVYFYWRWPIALLLKSPGQSPKPCTVICNSRSINCRCVSIIHMHVPCGGHLQNTREILPENLYYSFAVHFFHVLHICSHWVYMWRKNLPNSSLFPPMTAGLMIVKSSWKREGRTEHRLSPNGMGSPGNICCKQEAAFNKNKATIALMITHDC